MARGPDKQFDPNQALGTAMHGCLRASVRAETTAAEVEQALRLSKEFIETEKKLGGGVE